MKVSISSIAWKNEEEAAVAELLQEWGIKGVDVAYTKLWASPTDASREALQQYREFWARHEIQIIAMQSLIYGRPDLMLFDGPVAREQMLHYLGHVFRLAGILGARPLVFGSPKNRLKGDLPDGEAMDIARDFFLSAAEIAKRENVTLCIEPNPIAYGCDFIQTTTAALELVKLVSHPCFRLHLDAGIMTMNAEDIESAIESASEYLAHFHVSEPQLSIVGEGKVDHRRFAAALRRVGYQGWVAIEMRGGWNPRDIDSVRAALNYTLEVYGD